MTVDSAQERASRVTRSLGRLSAGAGGAAVLVTGVLFTGEWSGPAENTLGAGPFMIAMFWGLAALLLACLALPAWRGSVRGRRLLGAASLAGCAGALHWLSYEPGDARGHAVGIAVAVLLAIATGAAGLAEPRLHAHRGVGVALVAVPLLMLAAGLWRVDAQSETMAVAAEVSVLPDGRTVRSDFVTDSCAEPVRLEIEETANTVLVVTLIRMDRGFPQGCDGVPVPHRLEATLDAPLGSRVLQAP